MLFYMLFIHVINVSESLIQK